MPHSMPHPRSARPRVCVHTLGCPKNEADSRAVIRALIDAGVEIVDDPERATHIVLNTCGFITEAKEESIAVILDACTSHADKSVLVMGCLVQRYHRELQKQIPEVAGWFGLADSISAVEGLTGALGSLRVAADRGSAGSRRSRGGPVAHLPKGLASVAGHAYLKISDGCNGPCTFCAIPAIKGPYRSATTDDVLREADECLTGGARELVLVGQDTAVWQHGGLGLVGLIDLLAEDSRVRRIRVMYLQPEHVTDRLLEYMAGQPKLCRYLDVPFQHAHRDVLRRMGRSGEATDYLRLLVRARDLMPDVSVRSAFIVGFPGETEEHFRRLLDFVTQAGFDHAGAFVYSPEEGTTAASLRPRVPRRVAEGRVNRLNALLASRAESEHQRLVGSRVSVMIDSMDAEEAGEGTVAVGRTEAQAPDVDGVTFVEGTLPERAQVGDLVTVTISAAIGYDLIGTCGAP